MTQGGGTFDKGGNDALPWLSVVMPIYNGALTLRATLDSLIGQTDGLEILAINQGSVDDSRAILEEAASRLPLRIIDNPDGKGWTQNTNLGFQEARAPLVTMLHQDDVWASDRSQRLRRMSDAAPNVDFWVHGGSLIDPDGARIGRMAPPFGPKARIVSPDEAMEILFVQNTIALPATMFRRSAVLEAGGLDDTLWHTADWDLWLRLIEGGVYWDPVEAASFRVHGNSLTVTGSASTDGLRTQLETPHERYADRLPNSSRRRAERLAAASVEINVALAAGLYGHKAPLVKALGAVLALGPMNWPKFLANTQIVQRLAPRLRLLLRGSFKAPAASAKLAGTGP